MQGTLADFMIVVSLSRLVSRLIESPTNNPVHLLYSDNTGPQPSLPRFDDQCRERRTVPSERRDPSLDEVVATLQGVLGA